MSIKKSLYDELILESNDRSRSVGLIGGAILFEYFEDVFSPTITAKIKIVDNGNVIASQNNPDGDKQSIYNGLPLRGGERLSLKIAGNSSTNPGLDFSKRVEDYFYVSSITDVISESNRESFTLHLVSREAITNETSRVGKKFKVNSRISDSVENILRDYLKTNKIGKIDKSSNKYGFIGNLRKPFTILVWLASKGVPEKSGSATAGFLFYQTQDGFQFRSIDDLLDQSPKAIYTYTQSQESYDDSNKKLNNDFNILNYYVEKNQNLIEKLRLGTYASQRMFFNPLDFSFSKEADGKFRQSNYVGKTNNLGSQIKLPPLSEGSDLTLGDVPTRIITAVYDVGTLDPATSTDINSDQREYQSQSLMRYNILFTQTLSIIVPSNTNLRAGDIIECKFPKISQSDTKEYDTETSGLYMIKELCHHFDISRSYTSMKLIRDTFGINKKA
ncbi:tail protein [Synechococcus phage S-SRM01]|uniref:Uncharacterized protein n=1 Tax=Synechococcus phage S-SRM01 TaxID=2781608 RepID=A0A879R2Y1_9CAUD|nr:tail protein [Synechococcus phage S-SRM01]QPX48007.1 hypothetical protein [Synechococcus phage S-SRM01]